jgi:predicted transcriptional regulator of viral defense system
MAAKPRLGPILSKTPVLRAKEFGEFGISRLQLLDFEAKGELIRIGRGIYASPKIQEEARFTWIQAAAVVPNGVLCLLSALRFHDLTTQLPPDVWMALPRGAWALKNPPMSMTIVTLSKAYWESEVETHFIAHFPVRVYSAARTVVDCFKFRSKIGPDVAVEALRDFLKRNRGQSDRIWRLAQKARVQNIMLPYLDSLL